MGACHAANQLVEVNGTLGLDDRVDDQPQGGQVARLVEAAGIRWRLDDLRRDLDRGRGDGAVVRLAIRSRLVGTRREHVHAEEHALARLRDLHCRSEGEVGSRRGDGHRCRRGARRARRLPVRAARNEVADALQMAPLLLRVWCPCGDIGGPSGASPRDRRDPGRRRSRSSRPVLKRYLEYAETRGRAFVDRVGAMPESDFEAEVAYRLRSRMAVCPGFGP